MTPTTAVRTPTTSRPSAPAGVAAVVAVDEVGVAASRTVTTPATTPTTGSPTPGEDSDDDSDDDSGDDESSGADGATRRRRRRRRRKSGAGDDNDVSPDDPPNTVVHERAGRTDKRRQGQRRDSGHHRIDAAGGQASAPPRRPRCRAAPSADPERGRVPGPPRGRRAGDGGARQGPHRAAARGRPLHPDRGARRRRRRRTFRDVGGLGVAGRQHLSGHRAERAAVDGGGVRRHRPWPQRRAVRRRGELGGSRARWRHPQDRAGPQARRLRRRPGQQGSGRAQGRPADHAGFARRPLSGVRAGCVVDRYQPQAARHRTAAAQRDSARSGSVGCRA